VGGAEEGGRRGIREEQESGVGEAGAVEGGGAREERRQRHMGLWGGGAGEREEGERGRRERERESERKNRIYTCTYLNRKKEFSPVHCHCRPQPPRLLSLFYNRMDDDVIYINARCCCDTGSKFLAHSDSDGVG
jgi:hypothetical protein